MMCRFMQVSEIQSVLNVSSRGRAIVCCMEHNTRDFPIVDDLCPVGRIERLEQHMFARQKEATCDPS